MGGGTEMKRHATFGLGMLTIVLLSMTESSCLQLENKPICQEEANFSNVGRMSRLSSSLKKKFTAQSTPHELRTLLGDAHKSWGSGQVRLIWFFDDDSCLIQTDKRLTWGAALPEHFSLCMETVGIFAKCQFADIPCLSEMLDENDENLMDPVKNLCQWLCQQGIVLWEKESELTTLLGTFYDIEALEVPGYYTYRLWHLGDGMSFVGCFNQESELESGFVFPTRIISPPTEWCEFLYGNGMWRRLDDDIEGNFLNHSVVVNECL